MSLPMKNVGRARNRGLVSVVTTEYPRALDEAIEECALRERRTKRALLIRAVEEYLAARPAPSLSEDDT